MGSSSVKFLLLISLLILIILSGHLTCSAHLRKASQRPLPVYADTECGLGNGCGFIHYHQQTRIAKKVIIIGCVCQRNTHCVLKSDDTHDAVKYFNCFSENEATDKEPFPKEVPKYVDIEIMSPAEFKHHQ